MQTIGINEVAALAGVSPATVSRALRGIPGVAPKTRAVVEQAAERLGYVASPSASSLSTGRSGAIGILAPWLSRWFFASAIEGAQRALHGRYDVLLYPAGAGVVPGAGKLDVRALHKRVDGVLALNAPVGIDALSDLRIPVVTIGGIYHGFGAVLLDDVKVGRKATDHLISLGHRVIAFIGLDPDRVYGFTSADDRFAGYRESLAAAGLDFHETLVETSGFNIQAGSDALQRVWSAVTDGRAPTPTAVFAVSDEVAIGVMAAARRLGLSVPADLSVIGVDNHDMSYLFDLTTISQPVREQGELAAQLLLETIQNPNSEPSRIFVDSSIVYRNSTGPCRSP
jgi:LacI family repressor for deo operon, udp, cdd, tsx, nupC, and nupG